jgi:sec-independent protein translocase protein TatA
LPRAAAAWAISWEIPQMMIFLERCLAGTSTNLLAFIGGGLGFGELLVLGMIAVLLFGKNLPEVARSLGRSYNQFRRGLNDIQAEVYSSTNVSDYTPPAVDQASVSPDDTDIPTAPKFEPPTSEPQQAVAPEES